MATTLCIAPPILRSWRSEGTGHAPCTTACNLSDPDIAHWKAYIVDHVNANVKGIPNPDSPVCLFPPASLLA